MTQHDEQSTSKEERTQTEAVGDDFEAEVPQEAPSSAAPDDWPEGEVAPSDPIGPAIGQRFADAHAERPWLLPAIGAAVIVVVASAIGLRASRR